MESVDRATNKRDGGDYRLSFFLKADAASRRSVLTLLPDKQQFRSLAVQPPDFTETERQPHRVSRDIMRLQETSK
jgi:hypothetical protein